MLHQNSNPRLKHKIPEASLNFQWICFQLIDRKVPENWEADLRPYILSLTYNWCVLRYSQVTGLNKNFCRCFIGEVIREENYKGNAKTFISRLWVRWFIQFADFIVKVWLNRADPLVRPNLAAAVEVKDVLNGRSRKATLFANDQPNWSDWDLPEDWQWVL